MKTINDNMTFFLIFLLAGFLLLTNKGWAQDSTISIFIKESTDSSFIYLVPEENIEGLISNLQFSLVAKQAENLPDSFLLAADLRESIPLQRVDSSFANQGMFYQSYYAFGKLKLNESGQSWKGGDSILLVSMHNPYPGKSYSIAKDSWTLATNNEYYLEVNGEDRTGRTQKPTSTRNISYKILSVYPNPGRGQFKLDFPEKVENFQLSITDVLGNLVEKITVESTFTDHYIINLVGLPDGIYSLRFQYSTEIWAANILKIE